MALTARELEQNERARQNEWHRQNQEARKKFNESRLEDAHNVPGRYSPWEKRAMDEERKTIALRQHEMDMADKQHASDLAIQQEKTRGSGEAARQKGLADIELSKLQDGYTDKNGTFFPGSRTRLEQERIKAGLTQAENEMEAKMRIADIEDKGRDRDSQRRYGFFDKDGNYVGGSDYNTANVTGEHQAKAEQAKAAAQREMRLMSLQSREHSAEQAETTKRMRLDFQAALKNNEARTKILEMIGEDLFPGMTSDDWQKMPREDQDNWLRSMALEYTAPVAGAAGTGQGAAGTGQGTAGTGQGTAQPQRGGTAGAIPNVPGYSPKRVADIMAKGYRWDGRKWVK